jgi:hypothetical protein
MKQFAGRVLQTIEETSECFWPIYCHSDTHHPAMLRQRPEQPYLWRRSVAISKLEKSAWHPYFEHVSKLLDGKRAEVEVASLKIGDQIEAEWLPLKGINYNPDTDMIDVALEGVDHVIRHPREVFVDQEAVLLKSMEVIDTDNFQRIIKLRDPIMLPPPP